MVSEQFLSNASMVVIAKDAAGKPAAGVAVTWAITQGSGTIASPIKTTDANGIASANFLATNVPPGQSFFASTVTASTSGGSVNFIVTTVQSRQPNGGLAAPPLVALVNPPPDNRNITGASGSTLPAAVVVHVAAQSGFQLGQAVPNIGLRIINNQDPTATPPAACNGPNGLVLTDSTGTASCDLIITGQPGVTQLTAVVGEAQNTPLFNITVTPGVTCTYSLSSNTQSFGSNGGNGTVNVIAQSGCGWTAVSNAPWINITSAASGVGNGGVAYTIASNTTAARTGTLTIAGVTYTVNQSSGTPGSLAITTGAVLPQGTMGSSYSTTLTATGGASPYTWSVSGTLPTGLILNANSGVISGTPSTAGSFGFSATVRDSTGAVQSQTFSLSISTGGTSNLTITNTSFPNGTIGQPYKQLLTAIGGCVTPFSPAPNFSLSSGSLPAGLSIQTNSDFTGSITGTPTASGASTFSLTATDACGKTASASFTITIGGSGTAAQMTVTPPSVSFTVQAGGVNIPGDQTVAAASTSGALTYTAAVATASGGPWLVLKSAASGTTPGNIIVGATNFSTLTPGTYNGTITVTSSGTNSPVTVPVTLTVISVPTLTVNPLNYTINQAATSGSPVTRQPIAVASGTSVVHFTASANTINGGSWLSVSPTDGNTPASITAIISPGGLVPGTYSGSILITPAGGAAQTVTIILNVVSPASLLATPAPMSFSVPQGGTTVQQSLSLSSSASPIGFSASSFTSTGSWLTATPVNGTTPANITVSVSPGGLAPGSYNGLITIVPSDGTTAPLSITVTLTVSPAAPSISALTSAASFAPGPVSPGELITIFGSNMGPANAATLQVTPAGTVANTLAGTQVFFDSFPAPMVYASNGQVSAFVPYEVAGVGTTQVTLQYQNVKSNTLPIRVIESVPGIFVLDSSGQGAILNQDTTVNSTQNGALPGSVVSIFATGEGLLDPAIADGTVIGSIVPKPRLNVTVQIAGQQATVLYAGSGPGEPAGVLQVNAQVPAGLAHGSTASVVITVGTASSQAGVTLAVR